MKNKKLKKIAEKRNYSKKGIYLILFGLVLLLFVYFCNISLFNGEERRGEVYYPLFMGCVFVYLGITCLLPRKSYKSAFDYVKKSKYHIIIAFLLFVLSAIFGFVFSEHLSSLNELLKELVDKTEGLNLWELIIFIFTNNLQSSLFALFFGVILGLFSITVAVLNGIVLGYVLNYSWKLSGLSDFWRILPHGIFELPAVFISIGLGLKLGNFIFFKYQKEELKERLYNSLISVIYVIVPLLFIASIIEGLLIFFLP